MDLNVILHSFSAFNINAFNHILYQFTTNWWLIIFVISTIACVIMGAKETSQEIVLEEQNMF